MSIFKKLSVFLGLTPKSIPNDDKTDSKHDLMHQCQIVEVRCHAGSAIQITELNANFCETSRQKENITYNFDTLENISNIIAPQFTMYEIAEFSIKRIDYVLQRKATEFKKAGKMDFAIACLRKSNEIAIFNDMHSKSEHIRLVEFLKQNRQFEEARIEEGEIEKIFTVKIFYTIEHPRGTMETW